MKLLNSAFTLIELLVVIAIIGVLSSVVMIAINPAKRMGEARDAQRKMDLAQVYEAIEAYAVSHGTYVIPGTGWQGCSCGWFSLEGGNYAKSVARGLVETGYFKREVVDPSGGKICSASSGNAYMKYQCGNGFYLYAKLEYPSAEDLATYTASKAQGCPNLDYYGMNCAKGFRY